MEDVKEINYELFEKQNDLIFIANVYCFSSLKQTFGYKISENDKDLTGSLVSVKFGKKTLFGVIISIEENIIVSGKIKIKNKILDVEKIKNIDKVIYKNLLSCEFLDFLQKMAWYNIIRIERLLENVVLSAWVKKKREVKPIKDKTDDNAIKKIHLNEEQNLVSQSIKIDCFEVSVLYGVMGSGKTYIFLDVVRKILSQNTANQVLIMVPEIALTNNLVKIVFDYCGVEPIIWHSSVSIAKKKVYFENIINGKIRVVISTRSGLLLPYKKLSLIVIDEEHDNSYKQDEIPVYNARDMAILRAKCENIPVILSSATPSIETMLNVVNKKYKLYKINTQFFHIQPPEIKLLNTLNYGFNKNEEKYNIKDRKGEIVTHCISKSAREAILNTLKKGEQSMIFINRRGYSRTLKCNDCGYEIKCINCDNLLSYHKQKKVLKCHYCGYSVSEVKKCSRCGCENLYANKGAGVEQIEKELHTFCDAKTLLFSSDEIHKEGDIEKLSNEIKNGDIDVIIGTQIITKGHHFPKLTNIIVLDIDGMFLDGDFRASEKMFQLLFQLSGRAGREKRGAKIFIQTNNPDNKTLKLIEQRNLREFYINEIQQRKKFRLPPYSRFIAIIVSSEEKDLAIQTSEMILKELSKILPKNISILGPVESTMFFLKRNYRYRFLIKADRKSNIFTALNLFYNNLKCSRKVMVKIDIDPYSFL